MNPYTAELLIADRQRERQETARQSRRARVARAGREQKRAGEKVSGKRAPKVA